MIDVTSPGRDQAPKAETAAALLELGILVVLLVFLGIAAGKLFLLLGRLGIPAWKGLPLGLVYLAAAVYAARRVSIRVRSLQRGSRHDVD